MFWSNIFEVNSFGQKADYSPWGDTNSARYPYVSEVEASRVITAVIDRNPDGVGRPGSSAVATPGGGEKNLQTLGIKILYWDLMRNTLNL